ncbi:mechanosensitive ion channel domain-containing protein [Oleiagrimonas sp.]|jgi:miniconductance mechanosensitive channel|uniref:mechanosensitive ion channel family protein n=1 Tax=Oleiagrimonas sp. TaxID=2010330 RepID=UPI00261B9219|nr:mechanosensitive ion channel domain-containing protein [Oleiagrimonas sp.]MDA3914263.1 mechanosensitive ion channel [Oleiagrimonas sp.]
MHQFKALLDQPHASMILGLVVLVLLAWLANLLARLVLLRVVRVVTRRTVWTWDDAFLDAGVFKRLAKIVPVLVVQFGMPLVPDIPGRLDKAVADIATALIILIVLFSIGAMLTAVERLFERTPQGHMRSIKGYVQLAKIVLFVVGAIIIIATLANRSPLLLLSGLGAISAVLLLVFKDTILSMVASVQMASNDMLRVGDWISMPQFNADGDVIDIALHTVKVQNWDKTITTIPTWRLISDSFQNWRGMQDTGARRIKRGIYLDVGSIRFLSDEEKHELKRFRLLVDYLDHKREELAEWNDKLGEHGRVPVNQRRLTNVGTFRAYALAYLQAHPHINHDLTCMVRVMDPGPTGLPMEIYCFTDTTAWAEFEGIQGDIFDHLLVILPEFGLSIFQQPSGQDMRAGLGHLPGDRQAEPEA